MEQSTTDAISRVAMPSVLDKEISDFSKDAFGHQYFAKALESLIEGPHKPPFSIGLLGSWGTGKSSIKELYLSSLASGSSAPKGKQRRDRFKPVTFNAWRYGGGEDIKRALLRHVFIELGGDDVELRRCLYQQVTDTAQKKRSLSDWGKEALAQNFASLLLFCVLFIVVMTTIYVTAKSLGIDGGWSVATSIAFGTAVAGFLAKCVVDIRLKSPTLFNNQTVISFPTTSSEEYERLLVEQIHAFRKTKSGKTIERLVIFVDDLDRLSASEMVAGLDAVRTFLELPLANASDDFGVVFVISCDEDRVAEALSRGRGILKPELPGSVFTRYDARRYLDRLFQFRLEIPPFPKLDMRLFAENKLREAGSIVADLESRGVRVQDLIERLIHVGVESPRNAVQIVNSFVQSWWVAVLRERDGAGSVVPGVLYEGAVTNHPFALAALCALKVDFPDFYNELQKRPELIREFDRLIFKNESLESLAPGAKYALKDFIITSNDADNSSNQVRQEYRGLRQYLSSLQDLRWPKSLQPLLLLAQDTISRRFGDSAPELHDAFVSGDTQGVLEIFGHHLDRSDLEVDQIKLLEQLAKELSDETEARRINAARVLADLAPRIPSQLRRGLMVPLARQMSTSKITRMNVGPEAAQEIIESIPSIDRQDVVAAFAGDLLIKQKLDWQLPNRQTPNIDELTVSVKAAIDLVLSVFKRDGLNQNTAVLLKEWLIVREIQSANAEKALPFSELEKWVNEYPDQLLPLLNSEYSRLAIDTIDKDANSIADKSQVFAKLNIVFHDLAKNGEEDRKLLWQQLSKLVSVEDAEAVSVAWIEANRIANLSSAIQSREFLSAFATRLDKDMLAEGAWPLDWKAGGAKFLDLMVSWREHIDSKTASAISPLVYSWALGSDTADYMVRAAEILRENHNDVWHEFVDGVVDDELFTLPEQTLTYLSSQVGELTESERTELVQQMDAFVNKTQLSENTLKAYAGFARGISKSEWSLSPFESHWKNLSSRLVAMRNDTKYLDGLFPVSRDILVATPVGEAGDLLHQLFSQTANSIDQNSVLHKHMIGFWPEESDQIGDYDPTGIAKSALHIIKGNPSFAGAGYIFRSVVELADKELLVEDLDSEIANASIALWPHNAETVLATIDQIAPMLSPTHVVSLLKGQQRSDDVSFIAGKMAKVSDNAEIIAVTKEILSAEPQELGEEADGVLFMWLSALDEQTSVVQTLLSDEGLTDEQCCRLLNYVVQCRKKFSFDFITEIVRDFLVDTNREKTKQFLADRLTIISDVAADGEQQSKISRVLISIIPKISTKHLRIVGSVIEKFGASGYLERDKKVLDQLDAAQLKILSECFPSSRPLSKRLREKEKDAAE
ncbi:KAP family P-loop NTPase fold protein [Brucella intermedia]|uniref:KAP family P-loop NTPase fold protein n=1 Tax=Brucella intermedia TaxID=94625 RepID=UPI00165D1030|nr:P-loop NTPase fold protein [Brucella intermedia]QNQ39447.1 hypothetical protein IAR37_08685 [Brucella intermedia]